MYCGSRALEAVAVLLTSGGASVGALTRRASRKRDAERETFLVTRAARFDVATFAVASAAVMRCYANERDVFRSKYLNVLDYVFGNQGHARQRVRHVGSAYQLMTEPPEMPNGAAEKDEEARGRQKVGATAIS